jgi:hypothetical protein
MEVTYFSPQIPPAWLASDFVKDGVNKIYHTDSDEFVSEENDTDVFYTLNSYGYRETEYIEDYFKYDRVILAVGHSCIFGIDVRNEYCWPRLLETSLPNTRVLNFGIPRASMDTVARMITCIVPYFKPLCNKLEVAALWAQEDRREIFQENYMGTWSPWKEPPFPEYILSIDNISNRYNHQKNQAMVTAVCGQHNIPLHIVPWKLYEQATTTGKSPTIAHHQEMLISLLEQIQPKL